MTSAKEEVIALVERMPDEISMETIISELHFKLRVMQRVEQLERGEVVSQEEAEERLSRWLLSPRP